MIRGAFNIGQLATHARLFRHVGCRKFTTCTAHLQRKYTRDHEWLLMDDKNVGTVGITQYAADNLGDVVFVELPEIGTQVEPGATLAAVESVKAASDVYSPIMGKVIQVNQALQDKPEIINKSPMENGWLCKIQVENAENKALISQAEYDKFIQE